MAADLNPANTESSVVIRRPSLSVEVREGSVAHFGVDADASSPITYQWLRDDKPIVGETGATLWLVVSSADHFARISVLVKAGDSATQSDSTALRVRRD